MTKVAVFRPNYTPAHVAKARADYAAPSIYRPGTDISVSGWLGVPNNSNLAANMAEATRDDASYVQSPGLDVTMQAGIFAWNTPVPAGTWTITYAGEYTGAYGQMRISMLDASSSVLASGSRQALTSCWVEYTDTITIGATAPRFQIEVKL